MQVMQQRGPAEPMDIDHAAQRVTLDVIGRVGFSKDFGATKDLSSAQPNAAMYAMEASRDEGVKRWNNPLRQYCNFLPVSALQLTTVYY